MNTATRAAAPERLALGSRGLLGHRSRGAVAGLLIPLLVTPAALAQRREEAPAAPSAPRATPVLDAERAPEGPRAQPVVVGAGGSVARPMPVSTALFITGGVTAGVTSLLFTISVVLEAANAFSAGACAVRAAGSVVIGAAPPECAPPTPTTGWWIATSLGAVSTLALFVSGVALRAPESPRPARARSIAPRIYADHVTLGLGVEGRF